MNARSSPIPELVAQVAAAYFSNSPVSVADIPLVMRGIAEGLAFEGAVEGPERGVPAELDRAGGGAPQSESPVQQPTPAEIRQSIKRDGLTSFENGRTYRTLKRHLSLRGLTPKQYREKWGLPTDYPMTAASYSAARSAVAKRIGLGGRMTPKRTTRRARG